MPLTWDAQARKWKITPTVDPINTAGMVRDALVGAGRGVLDAARSVRR